MSIIIAGIFTDHVLIATDTFCVIVPEGSAYSPSRKMWRDPQGNLYQATGARMTPGAS